MGFATLAVKLITHTFNGRFRLAFLTKIPLMGRVVEYLFFEGDDIIYLPKNEVIKLGTIVKKPEDLVIPSQVIEYFINKANFLWIMNFCICRKSSQCQDYPIDYGCLFLGEATQYIKFGRGGT